MKKIVCVIPARLKSTRFPRKVLARLGGKALIERVWEAAKKVKRFDEVIIAVDSDEVAQEAKRFGARVEMTAPECPSGTDRLVALQERGIQADIWVNWQGDEPFLTEKMIEDLLLSVDDPSIDVWTLKKRIDDPSSPHVPKVVTDAKGRALYFSRSAIPYGADVYYKHIGIYAYRDDALRAIGQMAPTALEIAENLEQLRFLENGLTIAVSETQYEGFGIDIPEHLEHAKTLI